MLVIIVLSYVQDKKKYITMICTFISWNLGQKCMQLNPSRGKNKPAAPAAGADPSR